MYTVYPCDGTYIAKWMSNNAECKKYSTLTNGGNTYWEKIRKKRMHENKSCQL